MMQETTKSVKYLKELESCSMIQQRTAHFPTYYSNKWRESTKKMEARCGEYSFENFVECIHEASLDTNHPVFSRDPLNSTRRELEKKEAPLPKKPSETPIEEIRKDGTDIAPPFLP